MALDPIFADGPRMVPAPAGYYQTMDFLDEDIAGHEGDIETLEEQIAYNLELMPRLERETLQKQLEVVQHKLHICELKAKKAARIGGQSR